MTELDRQADIIRMTRYYLDRSYYPDPGREEYFSAFVLACEFLGMAPDSGTAQEAWERIKARHLGPDGKQGAGGAGLEGGPEDRGPENPPGGSVDLD
jgi:hypothetical protein